NGLTMEDRLKSTKSAPLHRVLKQQGPGTGPELELVPAVSALQLGEHREPQEGRTFRVDPESGYITVSRPTVPTIHTQPTPDEIQDAQSKIDDLQTELSAAEETGNSSLQFDINCKIGDLYWHTLQKPNKAVMYYEEMLTSAQAMHDKNKEAATYNKMAVALDVSGKHKEAMWNHERMMEIEKGAGNKDGIAACHANMASSLMNTGNVAEAVTHYESVMELAKEKNDKQRQLELARTLAGSFKYYTQELKLGEELNDRKAMIQACNVMGDMQMMEAKDRKAALKYYKHMLHYAEKTNDEENMALSYNRIGTVYGAMGEHVTALLWHQKDLRIRRNQEEEEDDNAMAKCIAYRNAALTYKILGNYDHAKSNYESANGLSAKSGSMLLQWMTTLELGELHQGQMGDPHTALWYYTQLLTLAEEMQDKEKVATAYRLVGMANDETGDHQSAIDWYQKTLRTWRNIGNKEGQIAAHKSIAKASMALEKFADTKQHYESAMALADELGNKGQTKQLLLLLGDLLRDDLNDPQAAAKRYAQLLKLMEEVQDKAGILLSYTRLGDLYRDKISDPNTAAKYYKEMLTVSEEVKDKNKAVVAYSRLGDLYREVLNDPEVAIKYYERVLVVSEELKDPAKMALACSRLGDLHREGVGNPQKVEYYKQMLALAEETQDKEKVALAYNRLGLTHGMMGKYEDAVDWQEKNLQLREEMGDKLKQVAAQMNLAASIKKLGNPKKAKFHYTAAMAHAVETGNRERQCSLAMHLGDLYREEFKEQKKAMKFYQQMLGMAEELDLKDDIALAFSKMGLGQEDKEGQMIGQQNMADSYTSWGKYEQAATLYATALAFAKELEDKQQQRDIILKLGDLHLDKCKKPQRALDFYIELRDLAEEMKDNGKLAVAYNRMGLAHDELGDHNEGSKWHQLAKKLKE
ncbi:Tetratricopeptide repeat protein 28, partial [Branchiostoma belcheri]